jgi:integrase
VRAFFAFLGKTLVKQPGKRLPSPAQNTYSSITLAATADGATGDLGLVQGLLGHSSRSTTEKYTRGRDTPAVQAGARKVYENQPMPQVRPHVLSETT